MGVFQSCNVPFCEKLTNTQGCVIRSVNCDGASMRELPKKVRHSCHALSHKAPKNVFIDGLVHCLALG